MSGATLCGKLQDVDWEGLRERGFAFKEQQGNVYG